MDRILHDTVLHFLLIYLIDRTEETTSNGGTSSGVVIYILLGTGFGESYLLVFGGILDGSTNNLCVLGSGKLGISSNNILTHESMRILVGVTRIEGTQTSL